MRPLTSHPPGPVTGLQLTRSGSHVTLSWTNPPDSDLAGVIIRWYPSAHAPGAWFTGNTAYQGTGSSASFTAPAIRWASWKRSWARRCCGGRRGG